MGRLRIRGISIARRRPGVAAEALLIGFAGVLLLGAGAIAQLDSPWVWGPRLGAFGDTFVTVTWNVLRPVEIEVRYGQAATYEADGTWEETLLFPRHQGIAEIRLDGLSPATRYAYQVMVYEGDATHPSPIGEFTTPTPGEYAFSLLVYGNTGGLPERHALVIDAMRARDGGALFVVNLGPIAGAGCADAFDEQLLDAIGELAVSRPYLTVAGLSERDCEAYYDSFALPIGGGTFDEQWWSFDVGGLHLVAIDVSTPEGPEAAAEIAEQVDWLAADLADNAARFTVVLMREAMYSAALPEGVNEELRLRWEDALIEGSVDLVLAGGAGRYEHLYIGGIHHVVTAGGGGPLIEPPRVAARGTVCARYRTLHYLRVSVSAEGLQVEAVPVAILHESGTDEDGAPIYEVEIVRFADPMDVFTIQP